MPNRLVPPFLWTVEGSRGMRPWRCPTLCPTEIETPPNRTVAVPSARWGSKFVITFCNWLTGASVSSYFDVGVVSIRHYLILFECEVHLPCQCHHQQGRLPPSCIYFRPIYRNGWQAAQPEIVDRSKVTRMPDVERRIEHICILEFFQLSLCVRKLTLQTEEYTIYYIRHTSCDNMKTKNLNNF